MSTYSIRQRWGMGPRVDPHFDARVGRIATSSIDTNRNEPAHGSGYIELEGDNPWEYLQALISMVYGEPPPGAGMLYRLFGALGVHDRPLVWTHLKDIRYLTTDPGCGVALPMRDFMPSPVNGKAQDAIQRLDAVTGHLLPKARVIGLTVGFDFGVMARKLQAAWNPSALQRLFGAGGQGASAHALFGGPRRAWPLGELASGMVGARRYGAQQLGVSATSTPQLASAMRLLQSPPANNPPNYGLPETGRGTIIGIVDFGCDFAHPSFRTGDQTRILALWDQNGESGTHPPVVTVDGASFNFGYGRLFRRADIHGVLAKWLSTAPDDPDFPYRELQYDPHQNHYTAHPPGEDGGPEGAHGTFVMEAAAGGPRTVGVPAGANPPRGVAPEADIVFVQVRQRERHDGRRVLDMNDVVDAVAFIFHVAAEDPDHRRPCVVNLSLNTMSGPHDGDGYFERRLASLLRSKGAGPDARGRAVVVAAGNLPGSDVQTDQWQHVSGEVTPAQPVSFHWRMASQDPTRNVVEIWYDADTAWLEVTLEAGDQKIGPVKPGMAVELMLEGKWGGCVIGSRLLPTLRANDVVEGQPGADTDESPGRHVILLELQPGPQAQAQWKVTLGVAPDTRLQPPANAKVKFDAWLERDDDGPSGLCRHDPPQAIEDPDRQCTVGTLSCGSDAIVVGAYSTFYANPEPWGYSGHGPNRRGEFKPDLAAPGHFLSMVRSRRGNGLPLALARASGTSIAAPFVTGTIACVYQRKPDATLQEVKEALIATAVPLPGKQREWTSDLGHGCLHPAGVLDRFR